MNTYASPLKSRSYWLENAFADQPVPEKENSRKTGSRTKLGVGREAVRNQTTPQKHSARATAGQMNNNTMGLTTSCSIMDLCPEEKARVAGLVRELAKSSEEAETLRSILGQEKERFEMESNRLLEQLRRHQIEKQKMQDQLLEAQRLLHAVQSRYLEGVTRPHTHCNETQTEDVKSQLRMSVVAVQTQETRFTVAASQTDQLEEPQERQHQPKVDGELPLRHITNLLTGLATQLHMGGRAMPPLQSRRSRSPESPQRLLSDSSETSASSQVPSVHMGHPREPMSYSREHIVPPRQTEVPQLGISPRQVDSRGVTDVHRTDLSSLMSDQESLSSIIACKRRGVKTVTVKPRCSSSPVRSPSLSSSESSAPFSAGEKELLSEIFYIHKS